MSSLANNPTNASRPPKFWSIMTIAAVLTVLACLAAGLVSTAGPARPDVTPTATSTPSPPRAGAPAQSWVYRVDTRSPSEIFGSGFTSRGNDYNLIRHVNGNFNARADDAYISTTESQTFARQFMRNMYTWAPADTTIWLYRIRPTAAFFSAVGALRDQDTRYMAPATAEDDPYREYFNTVIYTRSSEAEWAVPRVIPPVLIYDAQSFTYANNTLAPGEAESNTAYQDGTANWSGTAPDQAADAYLTAAAVREHQDAAQRAAEEQLDLLGATDEDNTAGIIFCQASTSGADPQRARRAVPAAGPAPIECPTHPALLGGSQSYYDGHAHAWYSAKMGYTWTTTTKNTYAITSMPSGCGVDMTQFEMRIQCYPNTNFDRFVVRLGAGGASETCVNQNFLHDAPGGLTGYGTGRWTDTSNPNAVIIGKADLWQRCGVSSSTPVRFAASGKPKLSVMFSGTSGWWSNIKVNPAINY